jgi:glucose 1-dehydrogenase
MNRFEGKTALVTGAARGIGRGCALALAQEGANIVINDLARSADAEATAAEIGALGRRALILPADVSDRQALAGVFAQSAAEFGRLDIVIANAGMSIRELVVEAQWEHVRRVIEVVQFGVFHTCQLAAQHMIAQPLTGRARGKIVIIGSLHRELPIPASAAYNMAKAAVNHLGRTLAAELTAYRINVNVINPGWIDTPGERNFASEQELIEAGPRIPWGRLGLPEDIGRAAAFLASDDADYITGTDLTVDGGYLLGLTLPGGDKM